jgi:hypothetical protein
VIEESIMSSEPRLQLSHDELFSAKVDEFLEEREALRRDVPEAPKQPFLVRLIYSAWFYLAIAGALGALLAWAVLEPHFKEGQEVEKTGLDQLVSFLFFPIIAGCIGLMLGAVEGLMNRNALRAFICSLVGLGVGFGGGLISVFLAGIIFVIMSAIARQFSPALREGEIPHGMAFLVLMMGRAAAWAVAAIPAGIGQGIALREKKVILNGLLGGVLGGLLGGLLFDPISLIFVINGKASVSRAIGFAVIGALVGLFVGLVEQWTKTAWLLMKAGPLAGKQFVIYRNPTVLGSSPKADIYLFKDAAIEPRHALIHNLAGRFTIEDCGTPDGTYVNGLPVRKQVLQSGDQIVLGKTVLEYSVRDSK